MTSSTITHLHESPGQESQSQTQSPSQSSTAILPSAPEESFRLLRLLALYPIPQILLETFPYPEETSRQKLNARSHIIDYSNGVGENAICPPYDAISYAWDPGSNGFDPARPSIASTQSVQVFTSTTLSNSTRPVFVTVTTHLLHGLLTAQELCSPTWIFVDAICVDQTHPRDKAIQVQNIHRVFRGAERVLIWLGMSSQSRAGLQSRSMSGFGLEITSALSVESNSGWTSEPALDSKVAKGGMRSETYLKADPSLDMLMQIDTGSCLNRVPSLVQGLRTYIQSRDSSTSSESYLSAGAAGLPSPQDPLWEALGRVSLNPWFSRLWTVQEACLARDAILLYGQYSLSWSMYAQMMALCERVITGHSAILQEQTKPELVNCLSTVYNGRVSVVEKLKKHAAPIGSRFADRIDESHRYGVCGSTLTLRILMDLVHRSKTNIALDRVYAVLGLVGDEVREAIQVSYSSELMGRFWVKWIEFIQVLLTVIPSSAEQILSNASFLERHPCLPSWCPNVADDGEQCGLLSQLSTSASAGKSGDFMNDSQFSTLTVIPEALEISFVGLKLDEIMYVVDLSWMRDALSWSQNLVKQEENISSEAAQRVVLAFWKCLEHMRETGTSVSDGDALLARCLVANSYDDEHSDPTQVLNDYTTFMQYLEYHFWGPGSGSSLKKSTRSTALKYGDRCQKITQKRAFFVTKSGRPGLCSCKAQTGDILCVFMNYQLPYLLRGGEDKGSFELIGEAYADGIMHGEALVGRDLSIEKLDRFTVH